MGGLRASSTGTAGFTGGKGPPIEKYPEIHDLAHKHILARNACKQHVHRANGLKRIDLVNRFTEINGATKDIKMVRKP